MRWNIDSSRLTSTTWPCAAVQGDHRGEGGGEPGDLVGEGDRRQQRLAVGLAVDARRSPTSPRRWWRTRAARRTGPSWPNPVTRVIDQPRVAGEQVAGRQAEALERARPEVLDEHVGLGDEVADEGEVVGILEVGDDRALVAVGQLPPQALAVALVAPRHVAQAVAAGPLDLDHVGAEVGEVAGAVRSGEHGRQVDDPDVGERAGVTCTIRRSRRARRPAAGRRRGRRGRAARRGCRARRCARRRARRCGRRRGSSTGGGR